MKCKVCGEEIVGIWTESWSTDSKGNWHERLTDLLCSGLRCGCYDRDGHSDCPYHICDGRVVRDESPPCPPPQPGSFDYLVAKFIVPAMVELISQPSVLDQLCVMQKEQKCEK